MNLKINQHHIYIVIFASFFFLWGVNLGDFEYLRSFFGHPNNLILNKIKLSYFIIFLIIPIFYSLIGEKDLFLKEIFNRQKYIIFFTLSIIAHFFLVKVYYNEIIDKTEISLN